MLVQKKRRRKKETFILKNAYNQENEEILDTEAQIRIKIKKVMIHHIGIENSINPVDLFVYVYGVRPEELNVYKRNYWWDMIKAVLRQLRRENDLFTIIKGSKIFVLSNDMELEYYIKVSNNHIKSIENLKKNAREWIKKKKWSKL